MKYIFCRKVSAPNPVLLSNFVTYFFLAFSQIQYATLWSSETPRELLLLPVGQWEPQNATHIFHCFISQEVCLELGYDHLFPSSLPSHTQYCAGNGCHVSVALCTNDVGSPFLITCRHTERTDPLPSPTTTPCAIYLVHIRPKLVSVYCWLCVLWDMSDRGFSGFKFEDGFF